MKSERFSLINRTMQHGVVMGLLFSANFIASTFHNSVIASLVSNFIIVAILILTYRYTVRFREDNNGILTFGQGFIFVFFLFFYASIISAGTKYVFLKYITPTYLDKMLVLSQQMMESIMPNGIPKDRYDALEVFLTPLNFTMAVSWMNFLMSLLVGLVVGLYSKRTLRSN